MGVEMSDVLLGASQRIGGVSRLRPFESQHELAADSLNCSGRAGLLADRFSERNFGARRAPHV